MKIEEETNGTENNSSKIDYVPNADVISLETIVHMMVNKGICTADELFMLEVNVQELNINDKKNQFVKIQNNFDRGRFSGLKKTMSKHSWSRKLGTMLFGWKWKKVKKN
ncbi:MAG TPA: hypothetical protein VGD14_13355 [bacterium]